MNYHLKQLLGKHDPKLLRIRQEISWTALNAMAQNGDAEYVMRYTKQKMAQQLALEIPLTITETPTQDTLQLDAQIYVFEKSELLALLAECYSLGSDAAKVMPNFSNF
jgi:hypothetical protein